MAVRRKPMLTNACYCLLGVVLIARFEKVEDDTEPIATSGIAYPFEGAKERSYSAWLSSSKS